MQASSQRVVLPPTIKCGYRVKASMDDGRVSTRFYQNLQAARRALTELSRLTKVVHVALDHGIYNVVEDMVYG